MKELSQHIKGFVPISEDHLAIILSKVNERRFSKKEHLLNAKEYAGEVFFILKGCVRTYVFDFNGVEHNISFAMEDWWFGDLQSFITKTPANYNIQALEDTTVLSISKKNWDELLAEVPEFANYTRLLFRNTMFAQDNRIVQNLSFTAQERYQYFMSKYKDLSQRISQKHIASYLGVTPEFFSLLRSKMKNQIS